MKITKKQLEKYKKTMTTLDDVWNINWSDLKELHDRQIGIRSTQIGALVMLLIELEIIK